jgi:prepilin-type N-terminal cleavage/methylation domain-containing protein
MNNIKKNVNKGFSLVELIVVVAIMAVLTAVLAPSLLAYVERTRAQKDDSAMGEVTNAIMLALADQDVYDEVLCYTCDNNYSCYIDDEGAEAKTSDANKVLTKDVADDDNDATLVDEGDHFLYNDNERLQDEKAYVPAGLMRGVTITFRPHKSTNKAYYTLSEGAINDLGKDDLNYIFGMPTDDEDAPVLGMTMGTMSSFDAAHNYLYNRVRATVGDSINLTSQTYRNSEYTVFIRMGTTGGFQADAQDAIMVYGQWNGTNLDIE